MRWHRKGNPGRAGHAPVPATPGTPLPPAAAGPGPVPVGTVSFRGLPRGDAILIGLAGATIVAFGLASIRSVAAPVLFALILTICLHPLRTAPERRGVPQGLATGSVAAAV